MKSDQKHETIEDHFRIFQFGSAIETATVENFEPFREYSGRFELYVVRKNHPKSEPLEAILRIDPDGLTLSGDLFVPGKDGTGGETKWLSWRSDALFVFDNKKTERPWDIAAVCEVRRSKSTSGSRSSELAFVTVSFAKDAEEKQIVSFRLSLISKTNLTPNPTDDFFFDANLTPPTKDRPVQVHYSRFREIDLDLTVDAALKKHPFFGQVLEHMLANRDCYSPLMSAIYSAGIFVKGAWLNEITVGAGGVVTDFTFNTYLSALTERPPDPFKFKVILSDQLDNDHRDRVPLGRALGMATPVQLFFDRTVAAVFPFEVLSSYREANPDVTLNDLNAGRFEEHHVEDMSFRLTFYILHELAHLWNLPHPWQRSAFDLPGLMNEPQARSWTNYGSLYPFGLLNAAALPKGSKERIEKSDDTMHSVFREEVAFTPSEKWHIRHAMFDDIAAGYQSFARKNLPTLKMKDQTDFDDGSSLRIDLLKMSQGQGIGARYDGAQKAFRFEPASGVVTLRLADTALGEGADSHSLRFRFGSGHLFLLIRSEFDRAEVTNKERTTLVYELPPLTLGPKQYRRSFMVGSLNKDKPEEGFQTYETILPLIRPTLLSEVLDDPKQITIQAVYFFPDGKRRIYSNQETIRYSPVSLDSALRPALRKLHCLLSDPQLLVVTQAARYFDAPKEVFPDRVDDFTNRICDPGLDVLIEQERFMWLSVERAILSGETCSEADGACRIGSIWEAISRINRRKHLEREAYLNKHALNRTDDQ